MIGGAGETASVRNNDLSVCLRLKGDRGEGGRGSFLTMTLIKCTGIVNVVHQFFFSGQFLMHTVELVVCCGRKGKIKIKKLIIWLSPT